MSELTSVEEKVLAKQFHAARRHLRTRYVLQSLRKRSGRLLVAFVVLAIVFTGVALLQHWFVHWQVHRTTSLQLGSWAEQVAAEIDYRDKWDLKGYRQASIPAPAWYVLTSNGLLIDIEGFLPGVFGRVSPPDDSVFVAPQTVETAVGDTWRLIGKKVEGGFVIVGIPRPENTVDADFKLVANAKKFGSTLTDAVSVGSREIDSAVDYAVVNSEGELKMDWGGVPLKIDVSRLSITTGHVERLITNGKPYLLYFKPILDASHQPVGAIIVPKDVSLDEQALRSQDRFNVWIVGITGALAVATALTLIVRELLSQKKGATLEEALKVGESRTVEFKSAFHWDVRRNQYVDERRLDSLKSIAGFLNARGGTLFIGVSEETNPPAVRGLDEDLRQVGGSRDKLQLTLRHLITARLGSEFSPLISDSLKESEGKLYWAVVVEESPEPAFVRWKFPGEAKEQKKFYVREGPKTTDLDNERTWHYIKNKWR